MRAVLIWMLTTLALIAPYASAQVTALVGGTLVDGTLREPIEDSVILIEGERIRAVGTVGTLPVPDGATVISTEGMTVLPGLWDMHVHLMIRAGHIPGPTLFVSGPFIQKEPYPGTEAFRWGVDSPADARAKVARLARAGVDVIKLIDQDQMNEAEVRAIVDEAHRHGLPVIAHAHRPEEIRRGLRAGVDGFEHTGLGAAPEYPEDIVALLRERTANMAAGPLFWTPTIEGLYNFPYTVRHHEHIDGTAWHEGLPPGIVADIRQSLAHPERISYFQQTPQRWPTLKRKFEQLRESGALLLVGTDSGIPMKFHSGSTWNELDVWVNRLGVPPVDAIRAATYWPAVAMKADRDYGTVTEGKYADIIAVRGDALRHIALLQRVDLVIKHGRRVK